MCQRDIFLAGREWLQGYASNYWERENNRFFTPRNPLNNYAIGTHPFLFSWPIYVLGSVISCLLLFCKKSGVVYCLLQGSSGFLFWFCPSAQLWSLLCTLIQSNFRFLESREMFHNCPSIHRALKNTISFLFKAGQSHITCLAGSSASFSPFCVHGYPVSRQQSNHFLTCSV